MCLSKFWRRHRRDKREDLPFSAVHDFRSLFNLLDQKCVLWGSQKCYSAQELKVLINRVRTTNQALRLPLHVIPETGGLRQKVQELCAEMNRTHDQSAKPDSRPALAPLCVDP